MLRFSLDSRAAEAHYLVINVRLKYNFYAWYQRVVPSFTDGKHTSSLTVKIFLLLLVFLAVFSHKTANLKLAL